MSDEIYYKSELALVRDAKLEDIDYLAMHLREEDKKEIWRSHHQTPQTALLEGFNNSTLCLAVEYKRNPIGMFGVVPQTILGRKAAIWLLGSPEIEKIQRAFLKQSRRFINLMLDYYPFLQNWVDAENLKSIQWLKWLKADIEEPAPYGVEGALFRYFQFRRKRV